VGDASGGFGHGDVGTGDDGAGGVEYLAFDLRDGHGLWIGEWREERETCQKRRKTAPINLDHTLTP
jgi:hypothetical protein